MTSHFFKFFKIKLILGIQDTCLNSIAHVMSGSTNSKNVFNLSKPLVSYRNEGGSCITAIFAFNACAKSTFCSQQVFTKGVVLSSPTSLGSIPCNFSLCLLHVGDSTG